MIKIYLLALCCVLLSAIAQVVLKAGMRASPELSGGVFAALLHTFLNPLVIGGMALYFLSAVLWLAVLAKLPVSTAYPFVSLGFVFTALFGWLAFSEAMPLGKIVGIAMIVVGVIFVAGS